MTIPIIIYGKTGCNDTERSRMHMQARGIPFTEINIDHDPPADQFVSFYNGGSRTTPTIIIGEGKRRVVLVEPTDLELDEELARWASDEG